MITYSCVSIDDDRVYFVYITVIRELTSTLIAAFELKSRATCAVVSTSCVNTEMLAHCQTSSVCEFVFEQIIFALELSTVTLVKLLLLLFLAELHQTRSEVRQTA